MDKLNRLALPLLFALSISGADFQNGQAARAVIGQETFSSQQPGIAATALSISGNSLYAADAAGHVFTFDLTRLPGPKDEAAERTDSACAVCGLAVSSVRSQSVQPGASAVSVFGKSVVIADPANHRVLIWRDSSNPEHRQGPDVILGRAMSEGVPVTAVTLAEPVSVAYDGKHLFVGDAALHRVLVWNSLPTRGSQAADAVLGQPDFASSAVQQPDAGAITRPSALASDGTSVFVADTANQRILVFSPGDVPLAASGVLNSATLAAGPLAPGALVTITAAVGAHEATAASADTAQALPTKLSGAEVVFNGTPLPLVSVSGTEIQAQIPYDLGDISSASLYVRAEHDGAVSVSNAVTLKIVAGSPGLYAFAGPEPRPAMALRSADNGNAGPEGSPVTEGNAAQPGDTITLWAAGLGDVSDSSSTLRAGVPFEGEDGTVVHLVSAFINGRSAEVLSARLPEGAVGVYEVKVAIPPDLADDARAKVHLLQDGYVSNTVILPVQSVNR